MEIQQCIRYKINKNKCRHVEAEDYDGYLIAIYLFDETALKIALREIDDQSLAVGLMSTSISVKSSPLRPGSLSFVIAGNNVVTDFL